MSRLKTLILIRHAHRDTVDHSRDNGLSEKGKEQVKRMLRFAEERLADLDPLFFSSAKKRCMETLAPLAQKYDKPVIPDARLTEQGAAESLAQYQSRIEDFLRYWQKECPPVTVVCSHGDWIPLSVYKLTQAKIGLKKAGWCEIELLGDEAYLTWLVQRH